MITPSFKLPKTRMTVVVWYRNGKRNEQLIETPVSCSRLAGVMFEQYRVGPSEIRALKAVEPGLLIGTKF
jgi:hypothetical protein